MNDFFRRIFSDGYNTYIDSRLRANLKGDIAKALYMYLQRNRREHKPYSIGLNKLCEYINLQTEGLLPFQLRQKISNGLQVLKDNGHLIKYKLDKDDNVSVWYAKQQKKKEPTSKAKGKTKDPNPLLTKMFMKLIDDEFSEKQKTTLIDGISTIDEFRKKIPKKTLNVPKLNREFGNLTNLCKNYYEWLDSLNWTDKLYVGVINADGKMWKKFIKEMEEEDCEGYKLE